MSTQRTAHGPHSKVIMLITENESADANVPSRMVDGGS
jgi:hypothetical protein